KEGRHEKATASRSGLRRDPALVDLRGLDVTGRSGCCLVYQPWGDTGMTWIALRMLTGDRSKYLGLIFGVTFATLLMTQQVSIFMGILTRTGNQILEVRDADIWVMDNRVRYLDEAPGLQDIDLMRVRGVPGVAWAVRTYRGIVRARLEDGNT